MAKRKKTLQDETGESAGEVTYADSNGSETDDGGNYKIGDLSLIDMGEKNDDYEATTTEEDRFSEYEEIDEKSPVAKKLQKTEEDELDDEVNLNQDDEFLKDVDFDPDEDTKYWDS